MNQGVLVIGLNHATAPVHVRELITFPGDADGRVSREIADVEGVDEAMILSTCNRAEIICITEDPERARERLIEAVGRIHGIDPARFGDFLYVREGEAAVRHIFRVASSLDSMVVGEPQILGQVKEGYRRATTVRATGPMLNRLLHRAFFTAKRIRNETGVGLAAVSVAYVAVELARKILGDLTDKAVLLIGAGEMAELAARHLAGQVQRPLTVINRTFETACALAKQLRGCAVEMERLEGGLSGADVVITSTASCEPIISARHMKQVMKKRRYRPLFLIDIAIPRDVEAQVNDIDGVYLYNIDDLQGVVEENLGERRQEALRGETIVDEEVDKFGKWASALDSTPTVIALRERLEQIRAAELSRLNGRISKMSPEDRQTVELITRAIINKIAHPPTSFLKRAKSKSTRTLYLDVAQKMFQLDGLTPPADTEEDPLDEG